MKSPSRFLVAVTCIAGAVASLRNIKNPSKVARVVMERSDHVLLVGEGALRFAKAHGFKEEDLLTDRAREEWLHWKETLSNQDDWLPPHSPDDKNIGGLFEPFYRHTGTIHCSAIDTHGNISCVTTTSGLAFKIPGRVGDSPLIGCGCYADTQAGGISCTGWGEAIMKIVMAKTAADFLRPPTGVAPLAAQAAAAEAVRLLAARARGTGGLIVLDCDGRPGMAFNTPRMAYGYVAADGSIFTSV